MSWLALCLTLSRWRRCGRSASNGTTFDGRSGPHFLHALDNHPIAWGQARRDEPLVAQGAVGRDRPLLDFAFGVHDQGDGISLGIARHGLLGNENGLLIHAFFNDRPNEHARQEITLAGLGTTIRRMTDPVVGSTVTSRNLSVPSWETLCRLPG